MNWIVFSKKIRSSLNLPAPMRVIQLRNRVSRDVTRLRLRSYRIWVGLKSKRREHTEPPKSHEDRGRDWNDVSTSLGTHRNCLE